LLFASCVRRCHILGLVSAAPLDTPFRTAYRHRHALSRPHERRDHRLARLLDPVTSDHMIHRHKSGIYGRRKGYLPRRRKGKG
jgi:hypothetical protein